MRKFLIIVGAFCLTGFLSNAEAKTKRQPKAKAQQAKVAAKKHVKLVASDFPVMQRIGKLANPPLTTEQLAFATSRLIWRRIPYSQLSPQERKDPNWSEGINSITGRVEAISNP